MNQKLDPEKEFNDVVNMITREFMLERCKLYKVRHRKNDDSLQTLCYKYLSKLEKMKPWEIPDDEFGNAGFVNPDRVLEDEAIRLILAGSINHPSKKLIERRIKDLIKDYINQVEFIEAVEEAKNISRKNRKKK
ncbi:MAG TPA: hypothetical protein PKA90_01900 [Ignavibacteria bacterium]|nr:hypothetical protein [Ignavibacteria bacterium]HMR39161.1 hypothetical protein [Ignavibacteria bacterium]